MIFNGMLLFLSRIHFILVENLTCQRLNVKFNQRLPDKMKCNISVSGVKLVRFCYFYHCSINITVKCNFPPTNLVKLIENKLSQMTNYLCEVFGVTYSQLYKRIMCIRSVFCTIGFVFHIELPIACCSYSVSLFYRIGNYQKS